MKRMAIFFGIIILLYSVYYDLNKGTLRLLYKDATVATAQPLADQEPVVNETKESISSTPYVEMEVLLVIPY